MLDGLSLDAFWQWLGRVADVASLVAAAFAFIAAKKIGALKRRLVFFGRLRELIAGIQRTLEHVRVLQASEGEPPQSQVIGEIRQCSVLVYRYQSGFAKDAQGHIQRLRLLEMRLLEVHTDDIEWQKAVDEVVTELGCLLVLAQDQLASREIGGDDA
ncbi:MAG TPA: hypothetical protein PKZ97_00625 [Azospirillaceae bacterium]|nr:hypothetical protein [Azospirillaceae bacterium]HRQ79599.1 hypothetical protein [Azospirillaceae bacterium]